jgi:large subunit ribosomal protein L31
LSKGFSSFFEFLTRGFFLIIRDIIYISHSFGGAKMKKGIHPELKPTTFVCGCGNTFTLLSTKGGTVYLEACNACHPFYTGKLRIKPFLLETAGKSVDAD